MDAVALAKDIRAECQDRVSPILISGAVGPRADGYRTGRMSADEAEDYHHLQVIAFASAEADLASAYTPYVAQAASF